MKRLTAMLGAAFMWLIFAASPAHALKVVVATIFAGEVQVIGIQAKKCASITWEGNVVTTSNKGGAFKFNTTDLPLDCVGELSDGVNTIDVVVDGCTTQQVVGGGVFKTGQTISYQTGDDGDLKKGVALPTPRFTDNTNGTITDNLTVLIWLKNANCPNGTRHWITALADVASLNSTGTMNSIDCGDTSAAGTHQTDWRLPNVRELFSLVNFGFFSPPLSNAAGTGQGSGSDPFSNFQTSAYWSSTTDAGGFDVASFRALVVSFHDIGIVFDVDKNNSFFVLAVRGGS
jgi:hypothetical protein